MKKTVTHLFTVGAFTFGPLVNVSSAEGPSDLEALADKAKIAAEKEVPKVEAKVAAPKPAEAAKEVVEEVKEEVAQVVEEVAEVVKPKVTAAQRAEALGLLSQVSDQATGVFSIYDGAGAWQELQETGLAKVAIELLAENEVELDDPESPAAQVAPIFGEEFMVVVGEGTPKQAENLVKLSQWNDKFQMALMFRMLEMGLEEGDLMGMTSSNPFESLMEGYQSDPNFLLNLITSAEMPPILLATRISDEETRETYRGGIEGGAEMALGLAGEEMPFLSAKAFEAGGVSFNSLVVDGNLLMESLEEDMGLRESLEAVMDPAASQDFINTLKEKNLILAAGVSDEAVYLYLGSDEADIPLVKEGGKSLLATDALAFCDGYLDEDLLTLTWVSEEFAETSGVNQPLLGSVIEGTQMGLKDTDAFGDTKKLSQLLTKLETVEKEFLGLRSYQETTSITYLRGDGLYAESLGGLDEGFYDWETPFTLGSDSKEAFFTSQWVESKEGRSISTNYLEAMAEAAYEAATLFSEFPEIDDDLEKFKEGFLLFDKKMKVDFLSLYQGLGTADQGIGYEAVMEIDLAGTWPTVPNVPEVIIEEGLAPRITLAAPIADAEKLAGSWKEIEKAAGKLLKTAGELAGEDIPMQRPMSSQANDLTTWFFPIPMQTDDFVPSVTLDDEVMVMGTSKKRAIALAALSKTAPQETTGITLDVNFAPLEKFLGAWLTLAEENPEELLVDEDFAEFFTEYGDRLQDLVNSIGELDSWKTHVRMEEGALRTSSQLKLK